MLIGYMRVSKADGSQTTDSQRDALELTGVDPKHLYEDQAYAFREPIFLLGDETANLMSR